MPNVRSPSGNAIRQPSTGGTSFIRASFTKHGLALGSVLLMTILAAPASAQGRPGAPTPPAPTQASPPPQQPAVEPQETSAVYGDWTLRCIRQGEGSPVRRLCEVAQSLRQQGQAQPFAQLALGRLETTRGWRIVVILPPNIALPSTVRIGSVEGQPPLVELAWRRCLPNACIAESELSAGALSKLQTGTETGRLTFQNAAGREITLLFPLRGLPQAIDALGKQG